MLLNPKEIKISQKRLLKSLEKIKEKSNLYYIGSAPTRLKIIFLLKFHKDLCPTDFSQILRLSMSAISHQLKLLERAGLVEKIKIGKRICYTLLDKRQEILKFN